METKHSILYPDCKDPNSFESGLQFQDFVVDCLLRELGLAISPYASRKWQYECGETRQGIEIKLDRRILETGNVSIEVGEKRDITVPNYTPSGILRNDNTWLYIQGNPSIIFIFAKSILLGLYQARRYRIDDLPTIRRFLLPVEQARKYAAKVMDFVPDSSNLQE